MHQIRKLSVSCMFVEHVHMGEVGQSSLKVILVRITIQNGVLNSVISDPEMRGAARRGKNASIGTQNFANLHLGVNSVKFRGVPISTSDH